MTDEARAARNAYKRAWNAANKDKVKAQQERHWEKRAASVVKIEHNNQDDYYFAPEMFAREFENILQEKRSAGEIRTAKPTPEQVEQIVMQIFRDGMKRPEVKDE